MSKVSPRLFYYYLKLFRSIDRLPFLSEPFGSLKMDPLLTGRFFWLPSFCQSLPFTVSHDWSMEEYNSVLMIVLDGAFAWSFMITPNLCNMLDITYLKRSIARLTAEYREFPRIQPFLQNGYIICKVCNMRQWYILRRREIIRMLIV